MTRTAARIRWTVALAVAILGPSISGCGSSGPPRYELTGTATYGGKPIPAGRIDFEPEEMIANQTTLAEAEIKDGQYKTLADKGVVGGKHKIFITGCNGIPEPGSGPHGASVFMRTYETTVELPEEPSTYDFDVPASHPASPKWRALTRGGRR